MEPNWLEAGLAALDEWHSIQSALAADQQTILTELFRDHIDSGFDYWAHFPEDDARDPVTGARFYYHAHDPSEWSLQEHGHFHLFVGEPDGPGFSHVVGVSMDAKGQPRRLFTTNGWVTGEVMRPAEELLSRLPEGFEINRSRPSWLVGRWLTALVALLMPEVQQLLVARDEAVTGAGGHRPDPATVEDRERHVLSECPLDMQAVLARWSQRVDSLQAEAELLSPPG
ncbi:hypothetical protein LV476_06595 [Guyparkeria hydrothermalis]|uniref:DUF6969 family protein n=1 Tax=Guyparkeria hydrothermalis TaxID=923 RepID=UPI0020229314|nr:hypothetical protein [Guyparkeria hydrothermalis]MCL7744616.1 hypothetical protein [Guyparkeria hydrothermalis]